MSDKGDDNSEQLEDPEQPAENSPPPIPEEPAKEQGGKTGELIVLALIVLSFVWYLAADRYTPYTTQARLQSYVVGIAPQVSGIVQEVLVNNNQEVELGQLLFMIEPSKYKIALDSARSQLENTWKQLEAGNASVQSARAALDSAIANQVKAQKDTARLQRLHAEDAGTISVRRLEVSQASLESANARVAKARADIDRAISQKGGDNDAENAQLRVAQSAVDKAQLDLSHTEIKAPVSGVITDLRTDSGYFAGTGAPVMTLLASHDVWINAEFTENNLRYLGEGISVEILFDSMPGQVFKGEIESIGVGVSAGQPPPPGVLPSINNNRDWLRQSQRFPVVVQFDPSQHEELAELIRVGGQASVMAYTSDSGMLFRLGQMYIRVMSWFSYVY